MKDILWIKCGKNVNRRAWAYNKGRRIKLRISVSWDEIKRSLIQRIHPGFQYQRLSFCQRHIAYCKDLLISSIYIPPTKTPVSFLKRNKFISFHNSWYFNNTYVNFPTQKSLVFRIPFCTKNYSCLTNYSFPGNFLLPCNLY